MSVLGGCLLASSLLVAYDLAASTAVAGRRWPSFTRRRDGAVRSPLAWLLVGGVNVYRAGWSSRNAGACRFEPSCSSYALEALRRFGGVRGGGLALYRLGRCQPLCSGGYDPVPARRARSNVRPAAHLPHNADTVTDTVTGAETAQPLAAVTPVVAYPDDPTNSADHSAGAERRLGTRA
jgi:uncharacterized protein